MINQDSKEYLDICNLYESGNYFQSLKLQCKLINENECSNIILIDFRKKLYNKYVSENYDITDDSIVLFECAIKRCTISNEKYNIPFIKKAISYLEQKNNVDYNIINKWLGYYNIELLNDEVFGNNKYSDKEMYYLKKAKTLDELKEIDELYELFDSYSKNKKQNLDISFFIKYHICRLLFDLRNFADANKYLNELVLIKREKYLLFLPIKYRDYSDEKRVLFYIIELLLDGVIQDYLYVYIINWLKESSFSYIENNISSYYTNDRMGIKINSYSEFKKSIISNICNDNRVKNSIRHGKIVNITKSGNAFISDEKNTYFVNKKYVMKHEKKGNIVDYFLIEKNNISDKKNNIEAIVISRRLLK